MKNSLGTKNMGRGLVLGLVLAAVPIQSASADQATDQRLNNLEQRISTLEYQVSQLQGGWSNGGSTGGGGSQRVTCVLTSASGVVYGGTGPDTRSATAEARGNCYRSEYYPQNCNTQTSITCR